MKFDKTEVFNFKGALRGMRNPMNSWDKNDSFCVGEGLYEDCLKCSDRNYCEHAMSSCGGREFRAGNYIGKNDLKLAQKLILGGSEHRKFLRQIFVSVDITAPIYWWKEASTYKISTTANSTSTMHKLATTPITRDCFEMDDYDGRLGLIDPQILDVRIDSWIDDLEQLRQMYLNTKDMRYWKELVRWLPESWLQTRTWTANYEVLRNIYFQRRGHKLSEWHTFCEWIESLPYAKELITYEGEK